MDLSDSIQVIREALNKKHLITVFGECSVDYVGRATSTLKKGKRLILIKGDDSISVHQNRLVRPTNYMVNSKISIELEGENAVLIARKLKPREKLTIKFESVKDVNSYPMEISNDLRLSGSEKHLNDLLMNDLSMIEEGLKPLNQQQHFKKGIADIIAEDKNGNYVIIELKRRQADFASVTQLHRYMKQVEKMKNKKTRGILLAPSIRKNAKNLLEEFGLEYAKLDFTLTPSSKEKAEITGLQKKQTTIKSYLEKEPH